jgi:hypothetical protein
MNKFVNKNLRQLISDTACTKFSWHGYSNNIAVENFISMRLLKGTYTNTNTHKPFDNTQLRFANVFPFFKIVPSTGTQSLPRKLFCPC